jgi:subfamily B ATP-binding cassette protein MsbA
MGVTVYRRMLAYIRPYRLRLLLAMLFMIVVSSFRGAIAFLVKPALDDIFINKDVTRLAVIPALVLGVYLIKGVCEFAQSYLMRGVGQRVIRDIRDHLYRHMQSLSLSFYMKHPTGVLMSRVTNDVGLMQGAVTEAVTGLIKDVFTALFLVGVIFYRDWKLALVGLVVFPLAIWPIARFGQKLRRTSIRTQEVTGGLTSHLQETISGAKLVKSFGAEEYEVDRFATRNAKLFRLSMKVVKVQAMTSPLSEMFAGVGAAAVIFYGGYSVVNGQSTPGNFFSFMTALFMLYEPVKSLSRINNVIQQGIAAASRVFEVLDTLPDVEERKDALALEGIEHGIEFDHVDFRYSEEGENILKDVTFRVSPGVLVAIVGSSGAGKTTLVDLLPRFYDPQRGAIRINGTDIRDVSLSSLRSLIGIVGQHTILFNDTLRNNIAYGMPDASMERIEEAARRANAHPFIIRLPEGYQTVIGEQGLKLSGGERQRVAIASRRHSSTLCMGGPPL